MTSEQLFMQNIDWAKRIARKFHSKLRNPAFDVEDLEQEALIEMERRTRMYSPERNDSFPGYAYLAVLGACKMSVRRRRFKDATGEALDTPEVASVVRSVSEQRGIDSHEAQRAAWRERRRVDLLRGKLHRLPENEQRMARLVLIEGRSFPDASRELGIGEPVLKRELRKVADKLRGREKRLNQTEAALLRAICELRGQVVTQAHLAAIVGKSQQAVSYAVNGLRGDGLIAVRPVVKKGSVLRGNIFVDKRLDRKIGTVKHFQQEMFQG